MKSHLTNINIIIIGGKHNEGMAKSISRGFGSLGYAVAIHDIGFLSRKVYKGTRLSGLLSRTLSSASLPVEELASLIRAMISKPNIVLIIKHDQMHESFYKLMKKTTDAVVFAFHPDDPFNKRTFFTKGPAHRRSIVQMKSVDHYLIWSHKLVRKCSQVGAKNVHYMPFACDPNLHSFGGLSPHEMKKFASDVCFIGNWDKEREGWLSALIDGGIDVDIWGSDYWKTRCRNPGVRGRWRGRPLFGIDMAKAMLSSKINLNILRVQNKNACNMRTFEIPCCGGFMLHEHSDELPALFSPGIECEDFNSHNDLLKKIRYYLKHDNERQKIAIAGHKKALEQTYTHWAEKVLQIYKGQISEEKTA